MSACLQHQAQGWAFETKHTISLKYGDPLDE